MNFKTRILYLVLLVNLSASVFAQQKTLTINDLQNRKLSPASLSNLQWRNNTTFTWTANNYLIQSSIEKGGCDSILSLIELNVAIENSGQKKLKSFPAYTWENDHLFRFTNDSKIFRFQTDMKQLTLVNSFDPESTKSEFEPTSGRVAFTKGNNLFVSDHGTIFAVTSDTIKGIVNGQSVHRNEFGINGGIFWSPKGSLLAFYRMDETMVTEYPLVNIDSRIAEVKYIRYPMAGMASHHVTIGIFNPDTKAVTFLKTGEPLEQYLTNVTWSPDEKSIFVTVLNRDQNHMWLNQYDAVSGNFVKTLFEETDEQYVEPLHGLYFLKSNPSQFIWQSRRDGFNHLYLYDISGNLVKQLTKGAWEVTNFQGFTENGTNLFFTSTQENPLERHLYALELKSGKILKLTNTKGTHTTLVSTDGKSILDKLTNLAVGSQTILVNEKGIQIRIIHEDINPLKDYQLGETSFVTLKSSDGNDLYGRLIKPVGFDPAKKYPVLVYVYGGPHSQLVTDTWLAGAGMFLNYMASRGYLVWTLDNRGTSNRGADFEQCIHRRLGDLESEDQMVGVDYLKSLPFVDASRIGVDGWS